MNDFYSMKMRFKIMEVFAEHDFYFQRLIGMDRIME